MALPQGYALARDAVSYKFAPGMVLGNNALPQGHALATARALCEKHVRFVRRILPVGRAFDIAIPPGHSETRFSPDIN